MLNSIEMSTSLDIVVKLKSRKGRNSLWLPSNNNPCKIGKTRMVCVRIPQSDIPISVQCSLRHLGGDEQHLKCFLSPEIEGDMFKRSHYQHNFKREELTSPKSAVFYLHVWRSGQTERYAIHKTPKYEVQVEVFSRDGKKFKVHSFVTTPVQNRRYESSTRARALAKLNTDAICKEITVFDLKFALLIEKLLSNDYDWLTDNQIYDICYEAQTV